MKKFAWIIGLAAIGLSVSTLNTGCGEDTPPPVIKDTTNNTAPVATDVVFTLNGDKKSVIVDTVNSFSQYSTVDNRTTIFVKGRTKEKSEAIEVELSFVGTNAGTFSIASGGANIEIAVGEGVRKIQYALKPREEVQIVVSTFGPVNGKLTGTFSGELQSTSLSSGTVTGGTFSIRRIEDL